MQISKQSIYEIQSHVLPQCGAYDYNHNSIVVERAWAGCVFALVLTTPPPLWSRAFEKMVRCRPCLSYTSSLMLTDCRTTCKESVTLMAEGIHLFLKRRNGKGSASLYEEAGERCNFS